jgi:hypothetical protein
MSTPIFPTSLPTVNQLSLQSISNVITDESTVKNFRRISRVPNANDKVQWTLFNDQLKIFIDFYKITLLDGHKWFYIKLPSAKGIVYHIARFKSLQTNVIGHKAWTVDAELELRERAFEVIEPIVDPEPPTGEPDVLSIYLNDNSNDYTLDQTRISVTDFSTRKTLSSADYAAFDSDTGVITLLQQGVYEVMCSMSFVGVNLLLNNVVVGVDIDASSDGGFGGTGVTTYPNSFPLIGNAGVNEGGPSYPTPTLRQIINLYNYSLGNLPYIVNVKPFAYKEGGTGTYNLTSIVISIHRFGDALYNPSGDT